MNIEEELDDSWIYQEETMEKGYDSFFMEDIHKIHVSILYLDEKKNIIKNKLQKYSLREKNVISKEEIVSLLVKNRTLNNKHYKLYLILKYHFNLEHEKIHQFNHIPEDFNFLWKVNFIDDIHFEKSLNHFNELNTLYIIFKENNALNHTKKVVLNEKNKTTKINTHTRKILKKEY